MAENEGKQEEANSNYADPLYLASSDHPQMQVTSLIFDGTNYLNWSRSVKMSLASKSKQGFIDGTCMKPEEGENDYCKWMRSDYMVRCWIFKSMNGKIADSLMLYVTAKELWDELMERYAESNAPQLYQMKKDLQKTEQRESSVSEYYCKMKTLWDEIQFLKDYPICQCEAGKSCKCNIIKKLNEMKEKNRLMDFLMGLDMEKYEGKVSNIIAKDPLPRVSRAYHLVQQLEKQKKIVEAVEGMSTTKMSAFNEGRDSKQRCQIRDFRKEKLNKKCDHCGMEDMRKWDV